MKSILIAAAGGLLALTALPATAQQAPPRPAQTQPAPPPAQTHPNAMMPGQKMAPQTRPAPAPPPAPPGPRPYQPQAGGPHGEMRYGRWDNAWGARPPAPPAHFARHDDWYRHVRACQQRYRSYNPRTDRFIPRRGRTARCGL